MTNQESSAIDIVEWTEPGLRITGVQVQVVPMDTSRVTLQVSGTVFEEEVFVCMPFQSLPNIGWANTLHSYADRDDVPDIADQIVSFTIGNKLVATA